MTFLLLEHANGSLRNNPLYMEHTNWEQCIMYNLQLEKLLRVFKPLPDFVAATLRIMKPESLTRAVVRLEEQEQVVQCRSY